MAFFCGCDEHSILRTDAPLLFLPTDADLAAAGATKGVPSREEAREVAIAAAVSAMAVAIEEWKHHAPHSKGCGEF